MSDYNLFRGYRLRMLIFYWFSDFSGCTSIDDIDKRKLQCILEKQIALQHDVDL